MDDIWGILFNRRSIRRYSKAPVSTEVLEAIIRAAARAPSAHNCQPWHFVIIRSQEVKNKLSLHMAKAWVKDMDVQGIAIDIKRKRIRRSIRMFTRAPVIIIPFLIKSRLNQEETEEFYGLEITMGIQSVALATGQLLLAAAVSGLGACWFAAPLFCPQVVRRQLGVDDSWEPMALITIGYPAEHPTSKKLRKVAEIRTYLAE